jgi:hypothetical protein
MKFPESIPDNNSDMFGIRKASPIGSTQGDIVFSRARSAARINGGQQWPAENGHVSQELIRRVMSEQSLKLRMDVLLAVGRPHLPIEITYGINLAGLEEDFAKFCQVMVFCSHLSTLKGDRINGLVMEKKQNEGDPNPFSFTEDQIGTITGDFIEDPYKIIFINSFSENGHPLSGTEYFPYLVYLLGYLKAGHDIKDPDSARHELKSFYAALYAMQATRTFINNLPPDVSGELKPDISSKLFPSLREQLIFIYHSLNAEEILSLSPEIISELETAGRSQKS